MMVCHCAVVNDRAIRDCIRDGAADLGDLAARCGAGSLCGGCTPELDRLLRERPCEGAVRRSVLVA